MDTYKTKLSIDTIPKLKPRKKDSHKHDYGSVVVIAGSRSMPGAALLSARAALRSGAGLVQMLHCKELMRDFLYPEIMYVNVAMPDGFLNESDVAGIIEQCRKAACVVIGPGLGNSDETKTAISTIISSLNRMFSDQDSGACIVDADALEVFASMVTSENFKVAKDVFILTPHPGEAARMLGISSREVQSDRIRTAEQLVTNFGSTIVLKGASSLIGSPTFSVPLRLSNGNPYMATAGSGDVLSGLLAAAIAQGLKVSSAALFGAFIHAEAGDRATKQSGGPITASLIIDQLSQLVGEYTNR